MVEKLFAGRQQWLDRRQQEYLQQIALAPPQKLPVLALDCLIQIYRYLQGDKCYDGVDGRALCGFVSRLCGEASHDPGAQEQDKEKSLLKLLTVACNLHHFLLQMKVPEVLTRPLFTMVLNCERLQIIPEHEKLCRIMLANLANQLAVGAVPKGPLDNNLSELITAFGGSARAVPLPKLWGLCLPPLLARLSLLVPDLSKHLKILLSQLLSMCPRSLLSATRDEVMGSLSCLPVIWKVTSTNPEDYPVFILALKLSLQISHEYPKVIEYLNALQSAVPSLRNESNKDKMKLKESQYTEIEKTAGLVGVPAWDCTLRILEYISVSSIRAAELLLTAGKNVSSLNVRGTCQGCLASAGVHTALRVLSSCRLQPQLVTLLKERLRLINLLWENKCQAWRRFWPMLESELHDTAVELFSSGRLEDSRSLFKMHLEACADAVKRDRSVCSITRVRRSFYNAGVCLLESCMFNDALHHCQLSILLETSVSTPDSPSASQQLSLQIKAAAHAQTEPQRGLSLLACTVWTTYKEIISQPENNISVLIKHFPVHNLSESLWQELQYFVQAWPSKHILQGVCDSLIELLLLHSSPPTPQQLHVEQLTLGCIKLPQLVRMSSKVLAVMSYKEVRLSGESVGKLAAILNTIYQEHKLSDSVEDKLLLGCVLHMQSVSQWETEAEGAGGVDKGAPSSPSAASSPAPPVPEALQLSHADTRCQTLLEALKLWEQAFKEMGDASDVDDEVLVLSSAACESAAQLLILHGMCVCAASAANTAFKMAASCRRSNMQLKVSMLRAAGLLLELCTLDEAFSTPACTAPEPPLFIQQMLPHVLELQKTQEHPQGQHAAQQYLINLATYYLSMGLWKKCHIILSWVHHQRGGGGRHWGPLSAGWALAHPHNLTLHSQAYLHSLQDTKQGVRGRTRCVCLRTWLQASERAAAACVKLGLVRRARALLVAPRAAAQTLLLPTVAARLTLLSAYADQLTEKYSEVRVKLDNVRYMLQEQESPNVTCGKKTVDINGGSPLFAAASFTSPQFLQHTKPCVCNKCSEPYIQDLIRKLLIAEVRYNCATTTINEATFYYQGVKHSCDMLQELQNELFLHVPVLSRDIVIGLKAAVLCRQIESLRALQQSYRDKDTKDPTDSEHAFCLAHSLIFDKEVENNCLLNDLTEDFNNQLKLSPTREPVDLKSMKTPALKGRRLPSRAPLRLQRQTHSPEVQRPVIKLTLDDGQEGEVEIQPPTSSKDPQPFTPAPALSKMRPALQMQSSNRIPVAKATNSVMANGDQKKTSTRRAGSSTVTEKTSKTTTATRSRNHALNTRSKI